jgi:hypothetical protein
VAGVLVTFANLVSFSQPCEELLTAKIAKDCRKGRKGLPAPMLVPINDSP